MYLGLHWLFTALHGLSLLAESRGCSLVVASGFLTVLAPLVASLVAEHGP